MGWWYYVTDAHEIYVVDAQDKKTAATDLFSMSGEFFDNPSGPYGAEDDARNAAQSYVDDLELDDE